MKILLPALFCLALGCVRAHAQIKPPPQVDRTLNITGQVSLPNGRPASRALVKLITAAGVPLQAITSDQGRFEFTGLKAGNYSLVANSMTEPPMISDTITTNAMAGGTDNLNVALTLREPAATNAASARPTVVSLEEAKQKVPKEALKAFRQGLKLRENHKDDDALESFSRAAAIYPDYFQAFSQRGDIYISQRKLNEAAAEFALALKVNPNYGPALRGSGYCRLEAKEFAEALRVFERAVSVEPAANTYFLLGISNLELDRRAPARQALLKALALDPTGAIRAHIYLANIYAREHEYKQAAEELKLYLDSGPLADDVPRLQKIEADWRTRSIKQDSRP